MCKIKPLEWVNVSAENTDADTQIALYRIEYSYYNLPKVSYNYTLSIKTIDKYLQCHGHSADYLKEVAENHYINLVKSCLVW